MRSEIQQEWVSNGDLIVFDLRLLRKIGKQASRSNIVIRKEVAVTICLMMDLSSCINNKNTDMILEEW